MLINEWEALFASFTVINVIISLPLAINVTCVYFVFSVNFKELNIAVIFTGTVYFLTYESLHSSNFDLFLSQAL